MDGALDGALRQPSKSIRGVPSSFRFPTILDLPDELLTIIFEYTNEKEEHVVSFQLACRGFRQRVLKMPCLWTRLSLEEDPRNSIERSGRCGLYIDLCLRDKSREPEVRSIFDTKRLIRFLDLVKPHYARWKIFDVAESFIDQMEHIVILNNFYKDLHEKVFTSLTEIRLEYEYGDEYFQSLIEIEGKHRDPTVLSHHEMNPMSVWRAPALRFLKTYRIHCIPLKILDCCVSTLEFGLSSPDIGILENMINLRTAQIFTSLLAQSFGKLGCLTLWIHDMYFSQIEEEVCVDLPRLHNLDFNIRGFHAPWILTSFTAPNVTAMHLRIFESELPQSIIPIVSALFPKGVCRFPRIDELSVTFEGDLDLGFTTPISEYTNALKHLLASLPRISVLRLSTELVEVPAVLGVAESERGASSTPPLRRLVLRECSNVKSFVESLKEVFRSPTFESLYISEIDLMEEEIRSMFPPEKVLEFGE